MNVLHHFENMKSRWQSLILKQFKIMIVYLDGSHKSPDNHKTVLNVCENCVETFFSIFFLNIYSSK